MNNVMYTGLFTLVMVLMAAIAFLYLESYFRP